MAENILAAACESETRKAAKRMRLEIYQSSQVCARSCWLRAKGSHPLVIPSTPAAGVDREVGGQTSRSLQLQHCGGQRGWREEGAKRWVGVLEDLVTKIAHLLEGRLTEYGSGRL